MELLLVVVLVVAVVMRCRSVAAVTPCSAVYTHHRRTR